MPARVTLLVLAYRTTHRLNACIRSIVADPIAPQFRLRILLNAVPELECEAVRRQYPNSTVLASAVNLGFAGGCNYAARGVDTEFLALLNDDAAAEPGWLRALLRCADQFPEAGAIGSRILFPDGRLQEAGSVVWRDGSTSPIGRGTARDAERYNAVRAVDFCSANGLLVRTSDWKLAGGFDEEYYPAYYEDADLCLKFRHHLGRCVFYEPRSVIRHWESSSSDAKDRAFLFRKHKAYFRRKWESELAEYPFAEAEPPNAVTHVAPVHTRVLVIDDRLPDSALGSGFGRYESLGKDLRDTGFAITFVATAERSRTADCLHDYGIETAPVQALERILKQERFDVVLASRPHNYLKYVPRVVRKQPHVLKVYDAEALFHIRIKREADIESDPARRAALQKQADAMFAAERKIVSDSNLVICTSAHEREVIRAFEANRTVLQLPLNPSIEPGDLAFDERSGLLFAAGWLGGNESPNVTALRWLAETVLPYVWNELPEAHLQVTGANAPSQATAYSNDRLSFTGHVDDLSSLYRAVRVAVVPMLFGAGVKVKTLEALQYGVPVVSTPVGAEGLPISCDAAIEVTDDAVEFASAIVRIYRDPRCWAKRRDNSLNLIRELLAARPNWREVLTQAIRD